MRSDVWNEQCRSAASKSDFLKTEAFSCVHHPLKAPKFPSITFCLPSDNLVQIHSGQCLCNNKTQPIIPWSLTNSLVFFWWRRPFPHPLQRLHFGFNFIAIMRQNQVSSPVMMLLKNLLDRLHCQAVPDRFHRLRFCDCQSAHHNFYTDTTHMKYFSHNLIQDQMLMPSLTTTSWTVKWGFPLITARTLSTR